MSGHSPIVSIWCLAFYGNILISILSFLALIHLSKSATTGVHILPESNPSVFNSPYKALILRFSIDFPHTVLFCFDNTEKDWVEIKFLNNGCFPWSMEPWSIDTHQFMLVSLGECRYGDRDMKKEEQWILSRITLNYTSKVALYFSSLSEGSVFLSVPVFSFSKSVQLTSGVCQHALSPFYAMTIFPDPSLHSPHVITRSSCFTSSIYFPNLCFNPICITSNIVYYSLPEVLHQGNP